MVAFEFLDLAAGHLTVGHLPCFLRRQHGMFGIANSAVNAQTGLGIGANEEIGGAKIGRFTQQIVKLEHLIIPFRAGDDPGDLRPRYTPRVGPHDPP